MLFQINFEWKEEMYESGSIIAEEGQPIQGLIVVEGTVSCGNGNIHYCHNLCAVLEDVTISKLNSSSKYSGTVQDSTMAVSSCRSFHRQASTVSKAAIFVPVFLEKLTSRVLVIDG